MELETKVYLFFLIFWSFFLQVVLTLSSTCFNKSQRWYSFGFYIFFTLLYLIIRYKNYKRDDILNPIVYEPEIVRRYDAYRA